MTYFTIVLRLGQDNKLEWYVEEVNKADEYYKIHKSFDLVFDNREECEDAIWDKIEERGGVLIDKVPVHGRKSYPKGQITRGKK